jgi:hypothetical protein
MKALSIKQPFAWLIVNGYKPVENRTWSTQFRGEFLVHAGLKFDRDAYDWVRETFPKIAMPEKAEFERGGIVGKVTLTKVVSKMNSKWFGGDVGFALSNPKRMRFIPLKGMLGFFEVPDSKLKKRTAKPRMQASE